MALLRHHTYDEAIWSSVAWEYPDLPASFAPGELLLDVGCHTGAVVRLGVERGATVLGFEANFENYLLAVLNLRGLPNIEVRQLAVWRSDLSDSHQLLFVPSADGENTGGGSVMFARPEDHWRARPRERAVGETPRRTLSAHPVRTVALDDVLMDVGRVRVLKLDAEGAEFPILLTSRRLDLVELIVGEYHEAGEEGMALLAPEARVGDECYSAALLCRTLERAGFDVDVRPYEGRRGHFTAVRQLHEDTQSTVRS